MRKRILLVDDDPSILKMTRLRLEHEGYEVLVAHDGEEALAQTSTDQAIDLILLDLKMPKVNGLEVCQRLKANPRTASIPVVLFTGSESLVDRLADVCIELGAADWIEKPFRSEALLGKIRKIIGERGTSATQKLAQERLRVLVADDDPKVHEFFVRSLQAAEYEVVTVASGQEAVNAVKAGTFSLAFVDVIMPGMDGLSTLKAILAEQPRLPVVMMTSYEVGDIVSLAFQLGATDFLRKPFDVLSNVQRFNGRSS
jgi:two-component system cell cycle response regulator